VVRGSVAINGESLGSGDAAALQDQDALSVRATEDSELLLFDMA
jgi:redox-sensitive bicupin YhaK (pirin superfamily)